ncbi:LysR family transcriptional regulator [Craterilacuibacter sinensis]|uniref:LysR family transcriptional regulator n=1 Tax=Craterilacuibacter sinensis TaxID=2686017 RepID=A0A845BR70_9NEIS|nr:LysR family transcriptional regulator [Craterilacuibacter sinensis]MXR37900.1 LysR family transcriptional regulator [Craterilacuibacter sinensis]
MTTHLTLRQLQAFLAVARLGSLAPAAEEQGLSRAALSQSLQELERQLGCTLFDRSGYRLRLNSAGETLLPMADELLTRARQIEQQFSEPDQLPTRLRLGASDTIGSYLLPQVVAQLLARFPDLQIEVGIHNSQTLLGQLQRYELDLALVEGEVLDSELAVTPWREDELWIVAPSHSTTAMDWPALRQQRWIVREAGSSSRIQFEQLVLPQLGSTPDTLTFNTSEAIVQAVCAGLGCALLSSLAVSKRVEDGALRRVELPQQLSRPMTIVRLKNRYATPRTVQILQWLADPESSPPR